MVPEQNDEPTLQSLPPVDRVKRLLWHAGISEKTERGILSEHRREQRLPMESRGTCSMRGSFERVPITVNDLSLRGLQFDIRQEVRIGDRCQVFICLPGYAPCRMDVEVRWVREARDAEGLYYRIGAMREVPRSSEGEPGRDP